MSEISTWLTAWSVRMGELGEHEGLVGSKRGEFAQDTILLARDDCHGLVGHGSIFAPCPPNGKPVSLARTSRAAPGAMLAAIRR